MKSRRKRRVPGQRTTGEKWLIFAWHSTEQTDDNGHRIVDKAELHYADRSVMWPRLMKDSESASEIAGLIAPGILVKLDWELPAYPPSSLSNAVLPSREISLR